MYGKKKAMMAPKPDAKMAMLKAALKKRKAEKTMEKMA